jgi:hypothetical protein
VGGELITVVNCAQASPEFTATVKKSARSVIAISRFVLRFNRQTRKLIESIDLAAARY